MKVKSIIRNALKMMGYLFLVVMVLEAYARIDDWLVWDAPLLGTYSHRTLSVIDEHGLHNRPNARFQKWHINSHGFRGPEITLEKPEGLTRIIVVGASESFGLYESEGMEYPAQMQTMLDALHPGKYQVLNAACPSLSTVPIHFYYNSWLKRFDPDMVVYYPAANSYTSVNAPPSEWTPRKRPTPLLPASRLAEKAKIVIKDFLPATWQVGARRFLINRKLAKHPPDWVWHEPPPERVELFRQHLTRFVTDVLDDSVRLVVTTKATSISEERNEFDRRNLTSWRRYYTRPSDECLLKFDAAANMVVREVCAASGIPVVDLESLLPKSEEYFADHVHLTNKGAEMIAAAIVETILDDNQPTSP